MSLTELIVSIAGDMSKLTQTINKAATEVSGYGKKFTEVGKSISSTGTALTAGVTVPITGAVLAGAGLVSWGSEIVASQGKVQAQLGLTGIEANALNEAAQAVWRQGFGDSISSVNSTIVTIRQNMGNLAGSELRNVAAGAITISDVFGGEVNEVTAAAGVLMRNFGIDGQHALDLITVGYQKGGDYSGELLDTLREYAPQFQTMGLNAEEFLSILVSGAQAGSWNLDKVGDSVKEFNIRAQDGSKTTMEGFAAIGLNADDMAKKIASGGDSAKNAFMATIAALAAMKDPVKQNAAGVALFGTQWEDVKKSVITAMSEGSTAIKSVSGATQEAANTVAANNPMLELTKATREMQADLLPVVKDQLIPLIRDDLLPIFRDTILPVIRDNLIPTISLLAQKFKDLDRPTQLIILAVLAFIAALGPVLVVVGAVIGAVGTLATALGSGGVLAVAFTAVKTAIVSVMGSIAGLGAPILIIIGIIALLAVAWSQNWFDIQGKTKAAVDFIVQTAQRLWQRLNDAWTAIKASATELGAMLGAALTAVGNNLASFAGWASTSLQNALTNFNNFKAQALAAWNAIKASIWATLQGLVNDLMTWANNQAAKLTDAVNKVNAFKAQALAAWAAIKASIWATLQGLVNDLVTWANNQAAKLTDAVNKVNAFKAQALAAWNATKASILTTLNGILQDFTNWINQQQAKLNDLLSKVNTFKTNVTSAWNSVKQNIITALNGILTELQNAAGKVSTALNNMITAIKNKASEFYNAGANIIDQIKKGVESKIQAVKDAITGLTSWISNNLPHSPAKEGPLSKALNFSSYISNPLTSAVKSAISKAGDYGKSIISSIASGVKSAGSAVGGAISTVVNKVKSYLPHSPADIGPFSTLPNWDAIFYDPMLASIKKTGELVLPLQNTLAQVKNPLGQYGAGFGALATLGNTVNNAGDNITVGPNTINNGIDLDYLLDLIDRRAADRRRARGMYR